ncbi:hypothetical protein J7T55_007840 [Diaporthe amygdali]|uniref:uncharacterized protein n=1 Tax=Phomopsis amygdali TaxID=1214568 RepID=UPI0022FE3504|nr:uncharacterized protein J7T55_007840 [Diaporthe amygdali]KAJ0107647.1 hypothetical protein J7T55_007840 [Diaporthe amygdali]
MRNVIPAVGPSSKPSALAYDGTRLERFEMPSYPPSFEATKTFWDEVHDISCPRQLNRRREDELGVYEQNSLMELEKRSLCVPSWYDPSGRPSGGDSVAKEALHSKQASYVQREGFDGCGLHIDPFRGPLAHAKNCVIAFSTSGIMWRAEWLKILKGNSKLESITVSFDWRRLGHNSTMPKLKIICLTNLYIALEVKDLKYALFIRKMAKPFSRLSEDKIRIRPSKVLSGGRQASVEFLGKGVFGSGQTMTSVCNNMQCLASQFPSADGAPGAASLSTKPS